MDLINNAECGPGNDLMQFAKQFERDRSLQQVCRPNLSPSQKDSRGSSRMDHEEIAETKSLSYYCIARMEFASSLSRLRVAVSANQAH